MKKLQKIANANLIKGVVSEVKGRPNFLTRLMKRIFTKSLPEEVRIKMPRVQTSEKALDELGAQMKATSQEYTDLRRMQDWSDMHIEPGFDIEEFIIQSFGEEERMSEEANRYRVLQDEYEAGRYIYKGANPNNYITFNNEIWRILSVENDGTLKIMKKDSIGNMAFDSSNSNNWARPAPLNTYLNNDYYNSLNSDAQNLIQAHTWGVGPVTYNNTDLAGQIASENGTTWSGNIGLMTLSEYLRANTNPSLCGNYSLNETNYSTCKTTNYIVPTSGYLWTVSPDASTAYIVFDVYSSGEVLSTFASNSYGVLPALYLTSNITLEGEGTEVNPYTIK